MTEKQPAPGVSRDERISDEGLLRLEAQLKRGSKISQSVLSQWIKRYGDAARKMLKQYDQYREEYEKDKL